MADDQTTARESVDTSAEAVEQLRDWLQRYAAHVQGSMADESEVAGRSKEAAAMIRALAAERDAEHERADKFMWQVRDTCTRAEAAERQLSEALARLERLEGDTKRLDFLDWLNRRLNAASGTVYRWKLITNHNVNRLTSGSRLDIDLHDSQAGKAGLPSCRDAIDERMRGLTRTALTPTTENGHDA